MSDPATLNCQEKGHYLLKKEGINNQKYFVCQFDDGSECEVWKFLKEKCKKGDFNPNDDYWEGSVVPLRKAGYDDYFEMLNGEKIGIDSDDDNIKKIIVTLRDVENQVIFQGKIENNVKDVGGKRLRVSKIIDLGGINFKEINEEESQKIALKTIKNNENFIKEEGKDLTLLKTNKKECLYCWEFEYSYTTKEKLEKKVKIFVQEGKIKDILFETPKENKIYDCLEFSMVKKCSNEKMPVCAKIEKNIPGIEENQSQIIWKDFQNPCLACTYKAKNEIILGYLQGDCP